MERFLVAAILVGVLARVVTLWTLPPRYDATAYMAEGHALAQGQGFTAPWGRYDDPYSSTPGATDLGPVYPVFLAVFYAAFGFSVDVTQAAGIVLALVVLVAAYVAGRDLYGNRTGLLTCAVLAANPWLVVFPGMEHSENMPTLFFVSALWGLLRGLRSGNPVHFGLAGLAAALFALTKAQSLSVGVIAFAAAGFLGWRVYERGRRAARGAPTWAFLAAFLAPLLAWTVWGPNPGPAPALSQPGPGEVAAAIVVKLALVLFSIGFTFAFLLPEFLRARHLLRTESGRLLWLSGIGLAALVWAMLVAAFAAGEMAGDPLWKAEQARHVVPVAVPLIWVAANAPPKAEIPRWFRVRRRDMRSLVSLALLGAIPVATWVGSYVDGLFLLVLAGAVHMRPTNARIAILLVLALLVATNGALDVHRAPYVRAGEWLQAHARPGDVVAVDPWSPYANGTVVPGPTYKYELYPYVAGHGIKVVPYRDGVNATYILSYRGDNYTGYVLIQELYWESEPGPLAGLWGALVNLGRGLLGRTAPDGPPTPEAWLLDRLP